MKKAILILVSMAVFASCNKTKKTNEDTLTASETSIQGKWILEYISDSTGNINTNVDRIWTFTGKNKIHWSLATDTAKADFYYAISGDNLYIDDTPEISGFFYEYKILELNPFVFRYSEEQQIGGGIYIVNYKCKR